MATEGRTITVLEPVGEVEEKRRGLAPRLHDLRGKRIGLLNNGKAHAGVFLNYLGQQIEARYSTGAIITKSKAHASIPALPQLLGELKAKCDGVITGFGD